MSATWDHTTDHTDDPAGYLAAPGPFGPLLETRLRLVTWNLWWRFGPWRARLPAIIETLRRLDADVVCLQEVWSDPTTSETSAAAIADALGVHHVHASHLDLDGIGMGNAVLSRWPIAGHDVRALPPPQGFEDAEERRLALRADIDGPRGPIQVFTTHLNWRLDHSHVRQHQVRELCRFIAGSPARTFPAVLCGDMNADPMSDEMRMLTGRAAVPEPPLVFFDAWDHAGVGDGFTWSNTNPYATKDLEHDRRIDFVYGGFPKAGGAGHLTHAELVGTEPVDGVVPSDHYGVLAELRY
jgi:endonuclease/exonuclease/phosphatase family metal-dependent hydrolase